MRRNVTLDDLCPNISTQKYVLREHPPSVSTVAINTLGLYISRFCNVFKDYLWEGNDYKTRIKDWYKVWWTIYKHIYMTNKSLENKTTLDYVQFTTIWLPSRLSGLGKKKNLQTCEGMLRYTWPFTSDDLKMISNPTFRFSFTKFKVNQIIFLNLTFEWPLTSNDV